MVRGSPAPLLRGGRGRAHGCWKYSWNGIFRDLWMIVWVSGKGGVEGLREDEGVNLFLGWW